MEEEIKGVMTRIESGLVTSTYSLYFTNKRIIRALTHSAAKKVGTFAAIGVLSFALNKHLAKKKSKKLTDINPDEILNENKRNIEIPFSSVKLVELKKPGRLKGAKMKIVTSDEEYSMNIKEKDEFDDYLELIKSVLADKLELK